ncbi:MAG: hypothetical protein ACW98F_03140 [Candidatus Hodarchaeales archaeon]|jgi:hypothetical protein
MYPELVQKLVDGGYYQTACPECDAKIILKAVIMVNTPKGITMVPTGPQEELIKILYELEVVDESGKPYSSGELGTRLRHNMDNLDQNPLLKRQAEMGKYFDDIAQKYRETKETKKKKRFRWF